MIRQKRNRAGFTLVELLTVLGIIILLVALSMAAVQRARNQGQIRKSNDVVVKAQTAVNKQYKAIVDGVKQEQLKNSTDYTNMLITCGDPDMAVALLTYGRIRQFFPQVYSEVTSFTIGTGNNAVIFAVKPQFQNPVNFSTATAGSATVDQQSAALLFAAVSAVAADGSGFATDDATSGGKSTLPIGSVSAPVFIDGFGNPVGFCRFGTNAELQASPYVNPKTPVGYRDPLDPTGKLQLLLPNQSATVQAQALAVFLSNSDTANATSFNGTNRIPVVYANGLNKVYESLDSNPFTGSSYAAKDDILGYRLVQIGQKGQQ